MNQTQTRNSPWGFLDDWLCCKKRFCLQTKIFLNFAPLILKPKLFTMALTTDEKKEIFKKHGGAVNNTGSSEGQIALFTQRINQMTDHLKINKKDNGTQRSLIRLVGKRRSLLDYLKEIDISRYRSVIKQLNIRK